MVTLSIFVGKVFYSPLQVFEITLFKKPKEPTFFRSGTKLQVLAWEHASPSVTEQIAILVTMSDYRQSCLEISFRSILSLADAIVLDHRLGLKKAVEFVSVVDPWNYPGTKARAPCLVYRQTQSAVDKATTAGKTLSLCTQESISSYLVSPLLVRTGDRPSLIRKRDAFRSSLPSGTAGAIQPNILQAELIPLVSLPHSPGSPLSPLFVTSFLLTPHSIAGPSEGAAEISPSSPVQSPFPRIAPAKTVASSSPTPLFSPGSVVRVLPDTTPGVRPMHAEGMLMARVSGNAGDGYYFITPTSIKKETPGVGRLARC